MNPRKLILFTSSFPHGKGEAFLEAELPYLSFSFDEIIICCPPSKEAKREIPANCRIIYIPAVWAINAMVMMKAVFNPVTIKEITFARSKLGWKNWLRAIKVIIKDMHDAMCFNSALLKELEGLTLSSTLCYTYWADYKTLALAKLRKKGLIQAFVTRFHRWDLYNETHDIPYLPFRSVIAEEAGRLFFISSHGKDYFNKTYHSPNQELLSVARLGTNSREKRHQNKKVNELTIVSVSAIIARKRVNLIYDAVSDFRDGLRWFHFGDGPEREQIFSNSNLKSNPHISFMGAVNNVELHEWYSQNPVDLFINVSSSEGVPVSIMEAFSYGIPVIATAVDGNPEIVEDGYNGFLLSANPCKEDVIQCIQRFMAMDGAEKHRLAENARNTWNEKYNAEVNFSRFAKELLEISRLNS